MKKNFYSVPYLFAKLGEAAAFCWIVIISWRRVYRTSDTWRLHKNLFKLRLFYEKGWMNTSPISFPESLREPLQNRAGCQFLSPPLPFHARRWESLLPKK